MNTLYIFGNLRRAACTDKNSCDSSVSEHPRQSHLRELLTSCGGDFIQTLQLGNKPFIDLTSNPGISLAYA